MVPKHIAHSRLWCIEALFPQQIACPKQRAVPRIILYIFKKLLHRLQKMRLVRLQEQCLLIRQSLSHLRPLHRTMLNILAEFSHHQRAIAAIELPLVMRIRKVLPILGHKKFAASLGLIQKALHSFAIALVPCMACVTFSSLHRCRCKAKCAGPQPLLHLAPGQTAFRSRSSLRALQGLHWSAQSIVHLSRKVADHAEAVCENIIRYLVRARWPPELRRSGPHAW